MPDAPRKKFRIACWACAGLIALKLTGELLALGIDARKRLTDPLPLLGDLVQYRHFYTFATE
jgi:hypothetical protein